MPFLVAVLLNFVFNTLATVVLFISVYSIVLLIWDFSYGFANFIF